MNHATDRLALPSLVLSSLVLLLAACTSPAQETPQGATPARIESQELGLVVAELPAGFSVEANGGDDGSSLRFVRTDAGGGTLTLLASEPQMAGVNLIQATKDHKEEILAQGEGTYSGTLELNGPFGTAYQSRGRYADPQGGGMVEDFRIYTVHPSGDRLVTLRYLYPVDENVKERQAHLFAFLGALEPLAPPAP